MATHLWQNCRARYNRTMAKQTVVLLILDGWGIGPPNEANPIHTTQIPTMDYIRTYYLCGALQSAGIAVGLPWDEEGNSEVGHLTLGAGKVLYQHYPRITMAIKDGSFYKNQALNEALDHAQKNNSVLHLAGLFGKGNVHSSYDHIIALLKLAQRRNCAHVRLHLFTDGKDSPPKAGIELIKKLRESLQEFGFGKVASISGRYYAMDRDAHWDRTERAYNAMVGKARVEPDIEKIFKNAYDRVHSDEFIEPAVTDPPLCVQENDSLVFFDFREDSVRQITQSFIDSAFDEFPIQKFSNLLVTTMTRYKESFAVPVAFSPETVEHPLGKVLAENGKNQLRIAETEKYAHVTYFFNGLKDAPFQNEYRVLVPSQNVPHHDEHPEMQTKEVADRVVEALQEGVYDFILVNFAASDIIAHSGNFKAAQVAIEVIDRELNRILQTIQVTGSVLVITADHGNLEQMLNPFTGEPETKHNPNPVPVYIVGNQYVQQKAPETARAREKEIVGILSDVAPTVLDIMGIPKPQEMTGESLVSRLVYRE